MENACRICRKEYNDYFLSIFSHYEGVLISEMISKTCPIDITFDDPIAQMLPSSVCTDCLEVIFAAYNLQILCIASDQYYRSLITNDQILVKSEKLDGEMDIKEELIDFPNEQAEAYDYFMDENELDMYLEPKAKKRKRNTKTSQNAGKERTVQKNVEASFFCDLCDTSCYSKKEIVKHMEVGHLNIRTRSDLKKSSSKGPWKCDDCQLIFRTKTERKQHINLNHNKQFRELEQHEIEISYRCCKCDANHATEAALMEHLSVHIEAFKADKAKCIFCPRSIANFKEFSEHSKYHAQPQTHECLQCKRLFPFDERLLKHVKNHKRIRADYVECPKCNQTFKSAKYLEVHDKVKHTHAMLFVCPTCGKALSTSSALDQHIRFVHNTEKEKKFECKYCSMKFVLKARLARHEVVHSTERPHVCETCGSSFKHANKLSRHKKIHDGSLEKKFKCTQCSFCFTTKNKLDQHNLTHSGLKPHECKYCDRAYTSKGDLVKHMQKNHVGDAIYQCSKCPRGFRLMVELREHQIEHGK